jgi:NAD(P)-dependent dehydrogenase (short-subunit alcohol dehydrogenase family)
MARRPSKHTTKRLIEVFSFDGKTVLVSGSTKGLGAETARQFADRGATVCVTGRNQECGESVVSDILSGGGNAFFVQHDVALKQSWLNVLDVIRNRTGKLHVLVNNAGVHQAKRLVDSDDADFDHQVNVNLRGVFLGCKTSIPLMLDSLSVGQSGAIINVSSVAGLVGTASQVLYSMTKGGLQLFSKSLALELAASKQSIRVNCVNPGMIDNGMGDELVKQLVGRDIFNDVAKAKQYLIRQIPMQRFATSSEVAKSIIFLASADASYITGIDMPLDGGLTAG